MIVHHSAAATTTITPRHYHTQAMKTQAMKTQAVKTQAVKPQAVKPQAVKPQAVKPQAVKPQAVKPQAVKPQAVSTMVGKSSTAGKPKAVSTMVGKSSTAGKPKAAIKTSVGNFKSVKVGVSSCTITHKAFEVVSSAKAAILFHKSIPSTNRFHLDLLGLLVKYSKLKAPRVEADQVQDAMHRFVCIVIGIDKWMCTLASSDDCAGITAVVLQVIDMVGRRIDIAVNSVDGKNKAAACGSLRVMMLQAESRLLSAEAAYEEANRMSLILNGIDALESVDCLELFDFMRSDVQTPVCDVASD
jgi:hypothetical protein